MYPLTPHCVSIFSLPPFLLLSSLFLAPLPLKNRCLISFPHYSALTSLPPSGAHCHLESHQTFDNGKSCAIHCVTLWFVARILLRGDVRNKCVPDFESALTCCRSKETFHRHAAFLTKRSGRPPFSNYGDMFCLKPDQFSAFIQEIDALNLMDALTLL